ncbi:MAG: tripartite tricarboxylate transporter substrate binding protein [Xanthobacteraceae bacterium]
MKIARRDLFWLSAGAAALNSMPCFAVADDYPSRPVRLIVGFAAAGPADIAARLIADRLSQRLGQPFIVENRAGGASNLATEMVVNAPPDGYTLLLIGSPNAVNATLYDNLSYNFIRDIAPVACTMRLTNVMVVNPSFPAKTVPEFIAYAKANPQKIDMATSGNGSPPHMLGEFFMMLTGVDLVPVSYRGAGAALVDLIAGRTQVMFEGIISSIDYIRTGKLRALGVTAATRAAALPDVPAIAEFVPGYDGGGWTGLGAPEGTSPAIIAKLNKEVGLALADPQFVERLGKLGAVPAPMSVAELTAFIAAETEKWAKVVKESGAKPE